jgi:hypothetical protein
MDQVKKNAIKTFFEIVQKLKDEEIIRSSKYSGDIAEYICQELYSLTLSPSQREVGYDGKDENEIRYQIKLNNSTQKTNQEVGDPTSYDNLLLVVTSDSLLFDSRYETAFILIYNIPSSQLNGIWLAKSVLHSFQPDKMLDRNLNAHIIE